MTDHTCRYCGRPVTPCANCGGTEGVMIPIGDSGLWIHNGPMNCVARLMADLKAARARVAELESLVSAYDDKSSQPKPGDFVAGWVIQADGTTRAYRIGVWPSTVIEELL